MKRAFAVLALLTCVACSKPESYPLPTDVKTAADDKDFQAAVKKLPEADRELLGKYMIRSALAQAFSGGVNHRDAKTIGEAIGAQRKFAAELAANEAEEKALATKVAAEREAAQKAMSSVLTVALTEKRIVPKSYEEHRYSDSVEITVAFQNKGSKPLKGAKGRMVFTDLFGDTIKSVGMKMEESIAPGETYVWQGSMDLNKFNDADKKLATTPQSKMKASWQPSNYLFADGSSMHAPDES